VLCVSWNVKEGFCFVPDLSGWYLLAQKRHYSSILQRDTIYSVGEVELMVLRLSSPENPDEEGERVM